MNEVIVTHVKPGETLSQIATRYGVSVDALQRWNRIENPNLVLVGQKIVIYKAENTPESSTSESAAPQAIPSSDVEGDSSGIWIAGAIVLGFLLLFLRRKRGATTPISRTPSPSPRQNRTARSQDGSIRHPTSVTEPLPAPEVNDGERRVSSELERHYPDWILIDDVLLRTGPETTTQIDHILVSPNAVFLVETKDMNGWVFGSPGDKEWTQSYATRHWSRKTGIKSKQFKFYNPLLQNEGHAKALVRLKIVSRWRLRPIVIFAGDSQMKTADKFLPFDEHEKMAKKSSTWRMRGVICMSLADLHRYIEFSVNASSHRDFTRQQMEQICDKIRAAEIPKTAESHSKHVDFVRSLKEKKSQ